MSQHKHFILNINVESSLVGQYDSAIVLLSYLVAVLAGFCALSVIRFIQTNKSIRFPLLLSGGIILGLGIWSMHFTAMLAFSLPIPILYDPVTTLISILPAILASVFFLNNLSSNDISATKVIYTGLLLAVGIATMHFIGMSAMSMKAYMSHDPLLLVLSILSSWGLAILTIALNTNQFKLKISQNKHLVLSALTYGFSVASMHYLAMSSTFFFPDESIGVSGIGNSTLTNSLILFTVILMTLLILVLFYKERISVLLQLASTHHERVIETIDNMQDGFILSDENNQILLVNKKFQHTFGQGHTISINDNLNTLYKKLAENHFKFRDKNQSKQMLDILGSKQNLAEPFKVLDNKQRWWLLRQNRTSADTIIQTWTDVTEQIAQENELVVAKNTAIETLENLRDTQEELLEAKKMASLGSLVTGVAHELNTPLGIGITSLSSIMEIVEGIQSSVISGSIRKSELENSLEKVYQFELLACKSLDRMAKLIQQFKYISVDQDVEDAQTFYPTNTIEELLIVWKAALEDKNLAFELDIEEGISAFGFENALIQILSCLISNSIEHAFEDGDKGIINISVKQSGTRLVILFQDNGCGIELGLANRVFEPFVTTKRSEGGIGLGLHIAYNLVSQKLKGNIKLLKPTTEYKTIFAINLPIDCPISSTNLP